MKIEKCMLAVRLRRARRKGQNSPPNCKLKREAESFTGTTFHFSQMEIECIPIGGIVDALHFGMLMLKPYLLSLATHKPAGNECADAIANYQASQANNSVADTGIPGAGPGGNPFSH
eukprot:1144208-Pelagomonas_calceolata.AAC.10